MKAAVAAIWVAFAAAPSLRAEEAEVAPIVVTGTFELRQGPSVTDQFTQHLLRQTETKRAIEEIQARSPWYYSRLWNYFPMRFESPSADPALFFMPRYLDLNYQHAEEMLRKSEKQSLFER
jgi:hypothetical protein